MRRPGPGRPLCHRIWDLERVCYGLEHCSGDLAFPGHPRPLLERSGPAACSAELLPARHGVRLPGPKPGFPLAGSFGPLTCQALAWKALGSRGPNTSTSLPPQSGPAPLPHGKPQWARARGPGSLRSATGQLHAGGPGGRQSCNARGGQLWTPSWDSRLPGRAGDGVKPGAGWWLWPAGR